MNVLSLKFQRRRLCSFERIHYWPSIQGRGEFVGLALEEANAGIPPLIAIVANLSGATGPGSQWLVNNGVNASGDFKTTPPLLTVQNNFMA